MTEIEMKEFFDNYMYETYFLRAKKIYELTNNLDLFLLKTLKKEFDVEKNIMFVTNFFNEKLSSL